MFKFFGQVLDFINMLVGIIVSGVQALVTVVASINMALPVLWASIALVPFPLASFIIMGVTLGLVLSLVGLLYGR